MCAYEDQHLALSIQSSILPVPVQRERLMSRTWYAWEPDLPLMRVLGGDCQESPV